jgi:hypothetical protein
MEARVLLWLFLPWIELLESLQEESPTAGYFLLSNMADCFSCLLKEDEQSE